MTKEKIRAIIREKLAERSGALGILPVEVSDTESLTQAGILDSFSFMTFLGEIEEEFGIQLNLAELDPSEFTSIEGLTRLFSSAKT